MIEIVGGAVGAILGICALIGLLVKFVLLPYLEKNLVKPINEVHRQTTVNGHSSADPTLLDRIDDKLWAFESAFNSRFENLNNLLLIHIATGHGNNPSQTPENRI